MAKSLKPVPLKPFIHGDACSWADIKERLDPAWSYVVIETTADTPSADIFHTVSALLAEHAAAIRKQEICRETSSGKLLMLVQILPEQAEALKRKLLNPMLPPSVAVYFYAHTPVGDES